MNGKGDNRRNWHKNWVKVGEGETDDQKYYQLLKNKNNEQKKR